MAKSIYICDTQNNKIVEKSIPDLTTVSEMTQYTSQTSQSINFIAANSTHLFYILDSERKIYKILLSDYSTVQSADYDGLISEYPYIMSMHADDAYLYFSQLDENDYIPSIVRLSVTDLTFVDETFNYIVDAVVYSIGYHSICTDAANVYLSNQDLGGTPQFIKLLKDDMSGLAVSDLFPSLEFYGVGDLATDGTNIYFEDWYNERLRRISCVDLSLDAVWMSTAGVQYYGIAVDDNHIYVSNSSDAVFKFLKSDLSWVATAGTVSGPGNDQFNEPYAIILSGFNIYVQDYANNRVVARAIADSMDYVSKYSHYVSYLADLYQPAGICTDGTYFYVAAHHDIEAPYFYKILKFEITDSLENAVFVDECYPGTAGRCQGCCTDGTYVYVVHNYNGNAPDDPSSIDGCRILILDCANMNAIVTIASYDGSTNLNGNAFPCCDDDYFYVRGVFYYGGGYAILKFEKYNPINGLVFVGYLLPLIDGDPDALTVDDNNLYLSSSAPLV